MPEKMRNDIEKEIRSLVEDTLEDEAKKAGREADELMLVEVLKHMGPPEKIAASYLPPRYLIGPELYPHFINTLRIVLSIVTVLAALGIGLSVGARAEAAQSVLEIIGHVIGSLIGALFQATGIVILIFAIVQFTTPEIKGLEKEWDPRKMYAEPDPAKVNLPGTLVEIAFTVLALVVFNFYNHWIGISTVENGEWRNIPLLTSAFFTYLPWLSLLWICQIGLNVWLSAKGIWSKRLRWASITLSVLNISILAWMLTGPAIVAIPGDVIIRSIEGLTLEATQRINEGILISVRLVIGLVLAMEIVEAGKHLYKLLRGRLPEPLVVK